MKITKELHLSRPARKSGGDRYESSRGGFVIYIPQYISRPEKGDAISIPLNRIKVTFEGGTEGYKAHMIENR